MNKNNRPVTLVEHNGKYVVLGFFRSALDRASEIAESVLRCWGQAFWPALVLSLPERSDPNRKFVWMGVVAAYFTTSIALHVGLAESASANSMVMALGILAFLLSLMSREIALSYMAISAVSDVTRLIFELFLTRPGHTGYMTPRLPFAVWEVAATALCCAILLRRSWKARQDRKIRDLAAIANKTA